MLKLTILVLCTFTSCKTTAQTVIVKDISEMKTEDWSVDGSVKKYFKDIDNDFASFLGTWIAPMGNNQTFVVSLYKVTKNPRRDTNGNVEYYVDDIEGHYRLVENYDLLNEQVIYTSNKHWVGTTDVYPGIYVMKSNDGIHSYGTVMDTSFPVSSPYYRQEGRLGMKILSTNPTTAQWRISKGSDAKPEDRVFNIPTDIILTKVN
ncbi:DUF6705 family protein [Flavobacterium suncheonense]|nr:DUF6705 family protein [Flavobacterium suncheonense]